MLCTPLGKPGVSAGYSASPREVFSANRQFAQFVAGPVTIDGTASGNPLNAPYTGVLSAGTLMGRPTGSFKFANSVIGLTSAAYAHTGGSSTTVQTDAATAAEIVRRLGASGSLKLTGPATAGGTVATATVSYSAVNTGTGAITLSAAAAADLVTGSLIQPADGSEAIVTLLCDPWGVKVVDPMSAVRLDVQGAQLLAAGGTINTAMIVNYPADAALKAWVKAALRTPCPGVNFSDDFA